MGVFLLSLKPREILRKASKQDLLVALESQLSPLFHLLDQDQLLISRRGAALDCGDPDLLIALE